MQGPSNNERRLKLIQKKKKILKDLLGLIKKEVSNHDQYRGGQAADDNFIDDDVSKLQCFVETNKLI